MTFRDGVWFAFCFLLCGLLQNVRADVDPIVVKVWRFSSFSIIYAEIFLGVVLFLQDEWHSIF